MRDCCFSLLRRPRLCWRRHRRRKQRILFARAKNSSCLSVENYDGYGCWMARKFTKFLPRLHLSFSFSLSLVHATSTLSPRDLVARRFIFLACAREREGILFSLIRNTTPRANTSSRANCTGYDSRRPRLVQVNRVLKFTLRYKTTRDNI